MSNWKTSLSNLTGNTTGGLLPKVKKIAFTAIAVTTLSFGILSAPLANATETTTVYYVYFNDKYIGTVSDKKLVDSVVKEKMKEMESTYDGFQLSTGEQLKYIPEQIFRSSVSTDNEQVVNELKQNLAIQAEAAAIVLDGENAVNLGSQQQAEEVIQKFKLAYVTQEQIDAVEARKADPTATLPALKENETRILDVRLSKNVSYSNVKVTPDQIMSVENAIKFLQTGAIEQQKYHVQEGDVLGSIANRNGLALKDMLAINPGVTENTVLKIGQELNITVSVPRLHVVVDLETLANEEIAFPREVVEDKSMPKGDKKVKQNGQNGQQLVTYKISQQNGQVVSKEATSRNVVKQPVTEITIKGTKVIPSRGTGQLSWPTVGGYISSPMGWRGGRMHKGIDIARPSNHTIKAADNGVVVSAGYSGSFGNKIMINHQNGLVTLYAHLSSIGVSVGQTVSKGQSIGVMGSTGNSTGTHLHFEVHQNGAPQNPMGYLR